MSATCTTSRASVPAATTTRYAPDVCAYDKGQREECEMPKPKDVVSARIVRSTVFSALAIILVFDLIQNRRVIPLAGNT